MAGDNRTPEKTIGEVKYAELKHENELRREGPNAPKSESGRQRAARGNQDRDRPPSAGGDNRTPDKTIGEVKYAEVRQSSSSEGR